jgi:hypothetical protein
LVLTKQSCNSRTGVGHIFQFKPFLNRSRRDEVTGEWRRLHNEELHESTSEDEIKKNEVGGACGTFGGQKSCIQNFSMETRWKDTTRKTKAKMEG